MIYIVDHQDSFTWNIVHQFSKFDNVYCSNYYDLNLKKLNNSDIIVLSPGPGSPKDYPATLNSEDIIEGSSNENEISIKRKSYRQKVKDFKTNKLKPECSTKIPKSNNDMTIVAKIPNVLEGVKLDT